MTPTIGRQVHYLVEDPTDHELSCILPATVVNVHNATRVDLYVIDRFEDTAYFVNSVVQGTSNCTWNWPKQQ